MTISVNRIGSVIRRLRTDPRARQRAVHRASVAVRQVIPAVGRRGYRLPPKAPGGQVPVTRPDLRVGVILDEFSELGFAYEWDQVVLTPTTWRAELARGVDLLFVESAWRGSGGSWSLAMTKPVPLRDELAALVAAAREAGVPTVFWNKEDPPNYDLFVETARLFDVVMTVDENCIPRYREDLGHDRVGLLPFAAQPRLHNPVRTTEPRYDVLFAGTWFAQKHDARRSQLRLLLDAALEFDLHIFSRQKGDPLYDFPRAYQSFLHDPLPYRDMLRAYQAFKVILNVNSVTDSPTMGSRRLFEASAGQHAIVSTPAASVKPFFGDDILVAGTAEEATEAVRILVNHREIRDRMALRAHRRVFDQHLYTHRVDEVLRAVGLPTVQQDDSISAVVATMRPAQVDHVVDTLAAQRHTQTELVLVTHGFAVDEASVRARAAERGLEQLVIRQADDSLTLGALMNLGTEAASGRYLAKMDDDNIYGEHYLSDLVRAFLFTDAQVVGKWAHYTYLTASGATILRFPEEEHRYTELVQGGTLLMERSLAATLRFEDVPRRVDTTFLDKVRAGGGRVYSADRFNFVSIRAARPDGHTWGITDAELLSRRCEVPFFGDPTVHVNV